MAAWRGSLLLPSCAGCPPNQGLHLRLHWCKGDPSQKGYSWCVLEFWGRGWILHGGIAANLCCCLPLPGRGKLRVFPSRNSCLESAGGGWELAQVLLRPMYCTSEIENNLFQASLPHLFSNSSASSAACPPFFRQSWLWLRAAKRRWRQCVSVMQVIPCVV